MLEVCLLGTGGMMPLPYRWLTSLMVRYYGKSILIDCGEGTQIAMKEKGWSPKPIKTQGLFIFFKFNTSDFKRKLRCNHTERIHRPGKPFGTDYRQWFCPFCISHC